MVLCWTVQHWAVFPVHVIVSHSLRPALEGGHSEESHHARQHVVKVEFAVDPPSLPDLHVVQLVLLELNVVPPWERSREREG